MSLFPGLGNAPTFEYGQYLSGCEQGYDFVLRVDRCLKKKTRKGDAFIVEFTVMESNAPSDPVGSSRTWFQKLTDTDIAFPAIKTFLITSMGFDMKRDAATIAAKMPPAVIDALGTEACEKQVLSGKVVRCRTVLKDKSKSEGKFTRHDFAPYKQEAASTL